MKEVFLYHSVFPSFLIVPSKSVSRVRGRGLEFASFFFTNILTFGIMFSL